MRTTFKKNERLFTIIGVALIAFLLGYLGSSLFTETGGGMSGAAGAFVEKTCDTSPLLLSDPTGIVLADPLNFRVGPGLNYQVNTTRTSLEFCTPVKLVGRTADYAWLEVRLMDGSNLGGWIFSGYVQTNLSISALDVTTGYGGPTTGAASSGRSVSVVIQGGQAAAFVNGMPANSNISATLSPSDGSAGKSLVVATSATDPNGNVTLTFPMPLKWADGTVITSGTMTLTLTAGGVTIYATITYYT